MALVEKHDQRPERSEKRPVLDAEDQRGLALLRKAKAEYRAGTLETISEEELKRSLGL